VVGVGEKLRVNRPLRSDERHRSRRTTTIYELLGNRKRRNHVPGGAATGDDGEDSR
jgi:hypothetical protein